MLSQNGIPIREDLQKVLPSAERLAKGPVAIAECFQCIPCNPCSTACPQNAITVAPDINATPVIDVEKCIGCRLCVAACPGLAIFVVDQSKDPARVTIPFEFLPVPKKGQWVQGLDRAGQPLGWFKVEQALQGQGENLTWMLTLSVPKELSMEVRNIKAGGYRDERE